MENQEGYESVALQKQPVNCIDLKFQQAKRIFNVAQVQKIPQGSVLHQQLHNPIQGNSNYSSADGLPFKD